MNFISVVGSQKFAWYGRYFGDLLRMDEMFFSTISPWCEEDFYFLFVSSQKLYWIDIWRKTRMDKRTLVSYVQSPPEFSDGFGFGFVGTRENSRPMWRYDERCWADRRDRLAELTDQADRVCGNDVWNRLLNWYVCTRFVRVKKFFVVQVWESKDYFGRSAVHWVTS